MRSDAVDELGCHITKAGLAGTSEVGLLKDFACRMRASGLPVARALVVVDTLHPVHEGRVFRWRSDGPDDVELLEYGRTNRGGAEEERWRQSPFFAMAETGDTSMRRHLDGGDDLDFAILSDMRDEGQTDWLALVDRFDADATIGEMDCIYTSWTTDVPGGFTDEHVHALKRLVPSLNLSIKSASLARIAQTLVETYLGHDAGRRVLDGRIERGVADRIEAALWFSDLRGYTRITAAARPNEIIPFLNDYAEAVISAVEEAGGDVLKLIGDGTLAIFTSENLADACACALRAQSLARDRVVAVNARRSADGLPVTEAYLGLHVGEVFYGNIGSQRRLDFTVVGPAVNEVARIGAMCRSAERNVLASKAFREILAMEHRERLVSVGRYALRGIEQPQELFTVMPGAGGIDMAADPAA